MPDLAGPLRLVSNIPPELQIGDLRDFFRDAIERGDFLCFHYTQRRQPVVEASEASDQLNAYLRKERERDRSRPGCSSLVGQAAWRGCVLVRLCSEAVAARFELHHHGTRWLLGRCVTPPWHILASTLTLILSLTLTLTRPARCCVSVPVDSLADEPNQPKPSIAEDEPVLTAAARQYPSLSRRPYLTRGQRREQLLSGGAAARPAAAAAGAAAVSAGADVAAGGAAAAAAVQPAAAAAAAAVSVSAAGVWRPLAEQLALPELHPPSCLPRGNVGTPSAELAQLVSACTLPPSVLREIGINLRQGAVSRPRHGPHTAEPLQYAVPPARRGGARRGGARRGGASSGEGDSGRGAGETDGGVSGADARRGARRGGAARAGPPAAASATTSPPSAPSAPSPPSPPSPPLSEVGGAPEPLECTREERARAARGAARRGEHDAAVAAAYGGRAAAWAEEEAQEAEVLLEAEVPAPPPLTLPPTLLHPPS